MKDLSNLSEREFLRGLIALNEPGSGQMLCGAMRRSGRPVTVTIDRILSMDDAWRVRMSWPGNEFCVKRTFMKTEYLLDFLELEGRCWS